MAQVTLSIGGRPMPVACRDGEEARVQLLGRMLDQRWPAAQRAAGGVNAERAMFLLALMLADDLDEAVNRRASDGGVSEAAIARIAERLERLADTLEQTAAST
jgi:cell division protein ZapA